MNCEQDIKTLLTIGENIVIEFKRAGNGPEHDTFESICAFLNRQGGDVLLGVTDDGKVIGLPPKAAPAMVRQIVNVMNDPNLWEPRIAVYPEVVVYRGKTIIRIHVPTGPDVYRFKGKCYDRVNESDVVVRGTAPIADMFIRKREIYTERRVYQFVTKADLRLDLLPRIRNMALSAHGPEHPWIHADDDTILRSARLLGRDPVSGKDCFNAAAVLLLGNDFIVGDCFPAYKTDALLRRVNEDRYDDRLTVTSNLITAFDELMKFGEKHLDDKFYLEGTTRVSIRSKILREMIGNTLVHREFTSALTARFIIERDQMFTENANKAINPGIITLENLKPYSKNPIIANFFHQIGRADELGSGVRNLYHYVKLYSGADPIFDEGDIFRLTVPLNADYSPEKGLARTKGPAVRNDPVNEAINAPTNDVIKEAIKEAIKKEPGINRPRLIKLTGKSRATVERAIAALITTRVIEHRGSKRTGGYFAVTAIKDGVTGSAEAISEAISEVISEAIKKEPGINKPRLASLTGKSLATVDRIIAALIAAGKIEHRGSKKTGGYYCK